MLMAQFFGEIFLQAIAIFTLFTGITGVIVSLLLLLAPRAFRSLGNFLNRSIDFDGKIVRLVDRDIPTDNLVYRHNIVSGAGLIVGSAFILVFMFYRLDVQGFVSVFFAGGKFTLSSEILISAMALVWKIAGVVGMLIGSILLFNPEQMRKIEKRLDTWFTTQPMWDKLDHSHPDVDALVSRRPIVFGSIGLVSSAILTFLAVKNLIAP